MPINIFQGFTVKERGLCKYSPLGQDLGATLVIIFIDDLDDKLDGVFAKFVDYIKWLMVYVPWWGRIHTDFDKLHKCSKNWGNETKTKASKSATLRKCNENKIFKNNVCIKALEQQNTSVLSQVARSKTDIGNLKKKHKRANETLYWVSWTGVCKRESYLPVSSALWEKVFVGRQSFIRRTGRMSCKAKWRIWTYLAQERELEGK